MENFTSLINSYLPEPHASLLNGILFGRDLFVTQSFYNNLKAVGLVHIVVLSGMNITMLSALILQTVIPLFGRRIATITTIVIIVIFIIFVGIEPPLIRAGITGILSLIGLMFGRKTLAVYTLILTSIIMIIIWPAWLTSISFQLSFGATLGIILFGNVEKESVKKNMVKENKIRLIISYIYEELRITLSAQLFTVPLIFIYFRQISLIAPIANILVSWTVAPIMVFGLISVAFGLLNWNVGFFVSWICYGLLQWLIFVIETLAKVPFAAVGI